MSEGTPTSLRIRGNGLDHHALEWRPQGTPSGTVVLVHGFMDAGATWDGVAPHLAREGRRVVALDMRGFGAGARAPSGSYYHFVDYVFDLADVVDELSPGVPVALVGHSMGGTITTLFAGTFPERVSRLVSMEGLGPPDHPFEIAPVRMRAWIDGVRRERVDSERSLARDEALARLAKNHPNVPKEVLASRLPHLTRARSDGRLTWRHDPLHRTTAPVPFFAQAFLAFVRRITCPVLFVSGGPTGWHVPDEEERLSAFANLTRVNIDGGGHMMHWTKPAEVVEVLSAFLS